MRLTGAKIYIYPEHFLAYAKNEMSILELFGRFIFSFGKGEGFSEYKENIKKYLELIKDSRKDFLPKLFSTDKEIIAFFKGWYVRYAVGTITTWNTIYRFIDFSSCLDYFWPSYLIMFCIKNKIFTDATVQKIENQIIKE